MKFSKKIIACLLVLSMMLSMTPMMAFANESTVASSAQEDLSTTATEENALGATFTLKGATYFDGHPFWGTKQMMVSHGNAEVPYNGWQLMELTVEIPYQDGLEVKAVTSTATSQYPEISKLEKDDQDSKWIFPFFFYDNGKYDFTIDYTLAGEAKTTTVSFVVDGLVSIKDIAMRRHLINEYGEFSGLSYQGGQYVTQDILAMTPSAGFFTFGLDGDNGRTAENTTSLDGLQYLTQATGLYLFKCEKLAAGETIAPVTQGYYPNMKRFRVSELNQRPQMPSHAYNAELVTQSIANMPALEELVINGTGFSDCTVFRKITDGKLDYLQAMANNIVSLDGIESQPNLSSINIGQNKIKSIEPLSKLNQINFLNLMRDQVFDLRPINQTLNQEAIAGNTVKGFAAKEQKITYDKTVISTLKGDAYQLELPMPIDIDGTLTDTSEVKVQYADSNSKTYPTSKSNGKVYISIPKTDVDSTKDNPFENTTFSFAFNNNNGTDTRTKGWFTGNVDFKASPHADEYRVLYDFESGTRGKALPPEVTDLLPVDGKVYSEGDTVKAIQPAQTTISVADGVWTFKGYDADSKIASAENADEHKHVTFTGTWIFEKKPVLTDATVTFKVENGTWADGSRDDKTVNVVLSNGKGTLETNQVPTGMKAAEGYEGGQWDVVPNTEENGITSNVTYTYRFIKQAQATVTFKVENGTWADGSCDDKTVNVVLSNGKGTLETNQVPTGMKAAEGYEGGQWDVVPNTAANGITGNVTYTYRFTKQAGGSGGGAVTTKYTLTYESNGGTEYAPEQYRANKVVSLDKVPTRERYQFTGWYADKALTQKIDSIKMNSDKTVYAGWKGNYIPGDLNSKDHVAYVVGYEDGTVKPDNNITRAETAAMLYRLLTDERRDEITTLTHSFSDMTADDWYAQAVASMANGGYIAGYEDGTFGGNNRITRAEFVTMLVRFIGSEAADCTFSDVPKSHWAYRNIATATNAGWISGYPDGTFGPNRNITRAEAMSIINRVLDRGVDADSTLLDFKQWPDNPKNAWYYYEVIEATNEHEYTGSRPSEDWTSLEIG